MSDESFLLLLSFLVLFGIYFWQDFLFGCPVKLYHSETTREMSTLIQGNLSSQSLAQMVRKECPQLAKPGSNVFYPHPFFSSGHVQTILSAFLAHWYASRVEFDREYVTMYDGGIVALDWAQSIESTNKKMNKSPYQPLVLHLHGLTGGSHETYVQDLVVALKKEHDLPSVVMNFRGCSGTELSTPHLYSASFTKDVETVIDFIKARYPNCILIAAGFSLGANILVKYTGEKQGNSKLDGIVSIGNPFDLLGSSRAMLRTWIGKVLYNQRMGQNLVKVFTRHAHLFKDSELDMALISKSKTVRDFDETCTRRAFGFRTVDEYYRKASSAQFIPDVQIPCLVLNSEDDPIVDAEVLPFQECTVNPNVIMAVTSRGGHLGWIRAGWDNFLPRERWFASPVAEFIHALVVSSVLEREYAPVQRVKSASIPIPVSTTLIKESVKEPTKELIKDSKDKAMARIQIDIKGHATKVVTAIATFLFIVQSLRR